MCICDNIHMHDLHEFASMYIVPDVLNLCYMYVNIFISHMEKISLLGFLFSLLLLHFISSENIFNLWDTILSYSIIPPDLECNLAAIAWFCWFLDLVPL